jgi:excisionase family DNA binding protein
MNETLASELMNIEDCSIYLGFSIQRLRKMCHKKEIPFIKLGRTVRFYRPDIIKWTMSKRVG